MTLNPHTWAEHALAAWRRAIHSSATAPRTVSTAFPWALLVAVIAQVLAAGSVFYLQVRNSQVGELQTQAILQQLCASTVGEVQTTVRRYLNSPVRSVIEPPAFEEITLRRDFDLSRVTSTFQAARDRFPHIEFFIWSERFPEIYANEVLFAVPAAAPRIRLASPGAPWQRHVVSSPELGRSVFTTVTNTPNGRIYTLAHTEVSGEMYEIVWRQFVWGSGGIGTRYAIAGFLVNLRPASASLLPQLMKSDLAQILNPDASLAKLALTVRDERGIIVYGDEPPPHTPSASARLDFRFFPNEALGPYLLTSVPPREWTLTVSALPSVVKQSATNWISGAAMFLIVTAILFAVTSVRQALRLAEMKADFVANVSHQLKTPLTILASASDTLQSGRLRAPEKLAEYTRLVRAQADRLTRLVDQILTFSKADARASSMQRFDLVELVRRSVTDFQHGAGDTCQITCELPDTSAIVHGDPVDLEQVVLNLLDNAAKYRRPGVPNTIVVRMEVSRGHVVLSVRDSGVGIDASELRIIFDKFYRGRGTESRSRGFGLGLAVVRGVVNAHNGTVSVTSGIGTGSEFRVRLPIARQA